MTNDPAYEPHHYAQPAIYLGEGSMYAKNRAARKARAAETQARRDRVDQVNRDRKAARLRKGVE